VSAAASFRYSVALRPPSSGVRHGVPQEQIDPRLVAAAVPLQPSKNVGVQSNGYGFFWRAIELADLRGAPVQDEGDIRKINVLVLHGCDGGDVSFLLLA